jgi:stringent starvation protein B
MAAPPPPARTSRRPYLLRAMHQWMTDNGFTPHVIVNSEAGGAAVPLAYARDGKIVLNLSYAATHDLDIGNEWVAFDARFGGAVQHVKFPVSAVLGVYARETGEGMVFSEADGDPAPPAPDGSPGPIPGPAGGGGAASAGAGQASAKRAKLKVVK